MYNTKHLRASVRSLIVDALSRMQVTGYEVSHAIEKTGAERFVVFALTDVTSLDGRNQIELELDVTTPMSDEDDAERVADILIGELDRRVCIENDFAFYIYKSTRNRLEDSDAHSARYRLTFDLSLYERI